MALLRSALSVTLGEQLVDTVEFVIGDAGERVGQPNLRIDAIQLGGFDQRIGNGG